jgi:protein involved in polysaccharide export with SLBB domain
VLEHDYKQALLISTLIAARASERDPCRSGAPDVYRIGAEALLRISVWKNEATSRTVPVRSDGKISLPFLNDVPAMGLTALELGEVLAPKIAE